MTFLSKATALAIPATALLLSTQSSAQSPDPRGYWITEFKKTRVTIGPCGKALCGTVMVKQEGEVKESPLKILIDMTPDGPNKWRGAAFDPENRSIYRASMSVESDTKLAVEGCAVGFCRKETWTRSRVGN